MYEVANALDTLEADSSVAAIIITGSEKAFAAGADIKEMANNTYSNCVSGNFLGHWNRVATTIKPVIAAVNGYAVGIKKKQQSSFNFQNFKFVINSRFILFYCLMIAEYYYEYEDII